MHGSSPAPDRLTKPLILMLLFAAFSFGAIVAVARADAYHVACVGHGFVAGSDPNDGSFFSRVETGCGSTHRYCAIYSYGVIRGSQDTYDSGSICNSWSRTFGNYTECAGGARVNNPGVFSDHTHLPDNWCG